MSRSALAPGGLLTGRYRVQALAFSMSRSALAPGFL